MRRYILQFLDIIITIKDCISTMIIFIMAEVTSYLKDKTASFFIVLNANIWCLKGRNEKWYWQLKTTFLWETSIENITYNDSIWKIIIV